MNWFTQKFERGFARLAFWRKPAPAIPETPIAVPAESTVRAQDQTTASQGQSRADMPTDAVPEKLPLLARLKNMFRRKATPGAEKTVVPEPGLTEGPNLGKSSSAPKAVVPPRDPASPSRTESGADVPADTVPEEKPSLLAWLKNRFGRKPGSDAAKVEDPPLSSEAGATADGEAVEVGRLQRVLARLSNKWVWIPGVSLIVLVPLVVMATMLMRSAQEKAHLQEALLAAQKQLELSTTVKKASTRLTSNRQTGDPLKQEDQPAVDGNPGVDEGDCLVTDQASVIKNLKNCIESFNDSTAR